MLYDYFVTVFSFVLYTDTLSSSDNVT